MTSGDLVAQEIERLPASLVRKCRKPEPGEGCLIRKSPPLAGLSAGKTDVFSEFRTGWLRTQSRSD